MFLEQTKTICNTHNMIPVFPLWSFWLIHKTSIYRAILQLHLSFLVLQRFLLWPTITFNSWPYLRVPSSSFFPHTCYDHISVLIRDDYLIHIMWLPHNADDSMAILNCIENCVTAVLRSSVHLKHQQTCIHHRWAFCTSDISSEQFVAWLL